MLGRPRTGDAQRAIDDVSNRLQAHFTAAGYVPIAPPHLYLGETLLSLYGEDLRARAFLFPDAERDNELCLRPDFTVPVALAHGNGGWNRQGAYTYHGPVFRRQQAGLGRPVEYIQAGVERFGDPNTTDTDASVMAILRQGLAELGIENPEVTIGDLSIPFALLDALDMPDQRRAALRRHFWRPTRFQDLLRRAVTPPAPTAQRLTLIAKVREGGLPGDVLDAEEVLGARTAGEVLERIDRLMQAGDMPVMPKADAKLIDAMLEVDGPATEVLDRMQNLSRQAGVDIDPALARFAARLEALAAHGINPEDLHFNAGFGRNLEYYDGFVFEMRARGRAAHPPLAGGGRYDTMTRHLGAAEVVPAVGGVIRPEAVLDIRGGVG